MHHCLRIYEILELIFEAVLHRKKYEDRAPGRTNLFALLQTCRSFGLPATKLLWRSLDSVVPLILTMPNDLVLVEVVSGSRRVTFRRDILASDWKRFDFYAPFVRRLVTMENVFLTPYMTLHDDIFHELGKRDKILLPNLGTIGVLSNDNLAFSGHLLGSRIHCIELSMEPRQLSSFARLIIAYIPIRAPSLKSLDLSIEMNAVFNYPSVFDTSLSTVLDSLDLEEFYCNWLDLSDGMLEALAYMPRLRKLSIFKNIQTRLFHLCPLPMPRLKEFTLWTDSEDFGPSSVAQVLVSLRPSQLEVFRILPGNQCMSSTPADMSDLVSTMQNYFSPRLLTHFELERRRKKSSEPPTIFDSQLLHPLFAFSNLRHFTLEAYPFNFTDAEVQKLAMSWPHLEKLHFDATVEVGSRTQTRTTLKCLLWFAIYCRNLRSLSFVFDGIDTFSDTELSLASNHKLSFLSVGYSTITEPEKVSTFFDTVFPCLSSFLYSGHMLDEITLEVWRQLLARTERR